MGTVTRYGREFQFDDSIPADVQEKRIQNWMGLHAADELKTAPAGEPSETPSAPPSSFKESLGRVGRKTGDYWRTVAQGLMPMSEEAIAGVRSLAGTPYDEALADERMRLKRYGEEHGETAKILTELGGAAATIPLTMGAGALLQGVRIPQLASLASKYPKIASVLGKSYVQAPLVGAGMGAVGGFGAGEGGFENRMENAAEMAPLGALAGTLGLGAVKGTEMLSNIFRKDNKVANYLRARLTQDRGEAYRGNPNIPRTATGEVDTSHPDFANLAGDDLKQALAEQRRLSMDPRGFGANKGQDVMTGDVMPSTMEAIMQKPGEDTAQLGRQLVQRQYDKNLPEVQSIAQSQYGHVGKAFDRSFGPDVFRGTDEALLASRRAAADAGFRPAYQHNIINEGIEDAMSRIQKLNPEIVRRAKLWADTAEGGPRTIGFIDRAGDQRNYNTQYLHDIKRSLDQEIGQEAMKSPKFNDKPYIDAKNALNKSMMEANPQYETAMKKYGEDSQLIEGLRKGRENVFGKNFDELDKGIGGEDIKKYLNDPDIPDAAKDLFRIGGARALRSNLLGSDAKAFTHNWADVLNKPNMAEKYRALADPQKLGSWDTFRAQMGQLSDRYKTTATALGNSRTNVRQEMVKELEDPNMLGEIVATGVNPHAPSTWRNWAQRLVNPAEAGRKTANATAKLLSQSGPRGNTQAVEQIKDLLSRYQGREAAFRAGKGRAPGIAAFGYPYRQYTPTDEQQ